MGPRFGGDIDQPAIVFERIIAPRLQQHRKAVVHQGTPARPVLAGGVVLLGPVAHAGHEAEAALGEVVEHGDVFGEPNRIVERDDQSIDADAHVSGASGHRGGQNQRRRQPAGRGQVMFFGADRGEPVVVGIFGHVERGAIALGVVCRRIGDVGHVQPQRGQQTHVRCVAVGLAPANSDPRSSCLAESSVTS